MHVVHVRHLLVPGRLAVTIALAAATALGLVAPAAPATAARPAHAALGAPAAPAARTVRATAAQHRLLVARPLVTRLRGVHAAHQVVSVTATHASSDTATLQAFTRSGSGWRRTFGPWPVWVGRGGFAARGHKREGDGRTPTGSFGFSFLFGAAPRPSGIHLRWRHAGTTSFWDDDASSSRYNEWVDSRHHSPGADPERLQVRPSYDAAAAIAYNTSRMPGRGSAIFLHVTHRSATSGCVALPRHRLLRVLRWLRPGDRPRIVMGTTSAVTR